MSVFTEAPVFDERLMNLHHVMPAGSLWHHRLRGGLSSGSRTLSASLRLPKRRNVREVYDILTG